MLLMIDNYESFTYNLVQYFLELGEEVVVRRNDAITLEEIAKLQPRYLVFSPGPYTPNEAGITLSAISAFAGKIPMLGVCLGHQAIAQAFGGKVVRAPRLMHGKTSSIFHDGRTIYRGLPNPFTATRYHSLIVEEATLPPCLEISARSEQGELMGLRHREYPIEGVQFHPESILTSVGKDLLKNFLEIYG
ncbi:MAG TPA: aminodeoxychorismate/anthranilate synthase component II [Moorella mulderi]|nr:aminodeoxychorismate/anthranilate synthase component II [Moorella mulderi]